MFKSFVEGALIIAVSALSVSATAAVLRDWGKGRPDPVDRWVHHEMKAAADWVRGLFANNPIEEWGIAGLGLGQGQPIWGVAKHQGAIPS